MSSENDLRVLCIGTDVGVATKSVNWNEEYNVKDYDWIFLDYYSLDQRVGDSTISEVFNEIVTPGKYDLFRAVATGSKVIVLLPERDPIPRNNHIEINISNHFPNNFYLISESGSSLNQDSIPSQWRWYFDSQFDWKMHISGESDICEYGDKEFIYEYQGLAENAAYEFLACKVLFKQIKETRSPRQNKTEHLPGEISYIPVIKNWDSNELIKEILDEFTDLDTRIKTKDSPEWVDEKSLPGEDETVSELGELRDQKNEIEQKIEEKNEDLQEFDRYKALLWGNENILEQLVPEVFSEFGFEVEGEQPHGRDGMILLNDKRFVMEITGTTGGIRDDKCRQLSTWVDNLELEDQEHDYTGLLVVNPDRRTQPSDRNPDEYLPPHLRKFLEKRDFHVLLTPNLYHLLSKYRTGEIEPEDIHDVLTGDDLIL
ncbi:hypothetical protein [Haloarcula sp. Atlit-7R]|uniref:hypothetical protein n=1 Tax=Haloarcula sp. Atlit-7R TaxID=2282125 RepID=UPI000EF16679|nr:hypothetical protein [Haloarcula sp. Atlit-7R]RLM96215.1 hypothetical protein D3D01_07260 [Haloarcula sp. Atlit-7R]